MKKLLLFISPLLWVCFISSCQKESKVQTEWVIFSPDSNLQSVITIEPASGSVYYSIVSGTDTVLRKSSLGISTSTKSFSENLSFVKADEIKSIDENYTLLTGKRKQNRNYAKELTLAFKNALLDTIQITFRAYNNGIAFKYTLPTSKQETATIVGENTSFAVPTEGKAWLQFYGLPTNWGPAYEEFYTNGSQIGANSPDSSGWSYPALFNTKSHWILITETNLQPNYCGTRLAQNCEGGVYKVRFPMGGDGLSTGRIQPVSSVPFSTPWRTIIVGKALGTIIESNLVNDLSMPQVNQDFSWVKPGRSSWSWWSEHDSPKDFKRLKAYVDLSKEFNWEYSLVDANWEKMKNGGSIEDLAKYASKLGVGLLLWYNSGGPHNNVTEGPREILFDPITRKEEFKKIAGWGVKGVKVDFFQSDKQNVIQLYYDILKDAADSHILVVFHGCTLPRGWSRTYPNLMSMEGVKGGEQYGWDKVFARQAASHNTILSATRNVVGSMDYTPVIFSDYTCCPHQTSNAHELGLSVLFESGILHFADNVDGYRKIDGKVKDFLKVVPVAWDDTKFVAGDPGKLMVIARKKGDQWFIAGANGDSTAKEFKLELPFIKEGKFHASIYSDGATGRIIDVKEQDFSSGDSISIKMLPKGGFVVWVKP